MRGQFEQNMMRRIPATLLPATSFNISRKENCRKYAIYEYFEFSECV